MSDICLGITGINNAKHVKKISKGSMPVAWHPIVWWDWCMSRRSK